jgi:uncharacterized repeat protein (TIGR03806 family)
MYRWLWGATILGIVWLLWDRLPTSAEPVAAGADRRDYGLERRIPWTRSKVIGSPEPPLPYKTEPAFARLPKFEQPYDLTYAPGTDRLFVAEYHGKIYSFANDKDVSQADLALELTGPQDPHGRPIRPVIRGITFHPRFADNGYLYVAWIPNPKKPGSPTGARLSRFTVRGKSPLIDPGSEKILFEWSSEGHTGGCLKFGPDGYLYLSTGDGSWMADGLNVGQDLSSVLAKLLRFDVDNPPPGKAYGIPKDNPFAATEGARPEVYAYGFRHLRFSFDRGRGPVTCLGADLGQAESHMVYAIEKGGNYGWPVMAGTQPFRPERRKGPTPILRPVVEQPASEFRWITGGFVYRGKRLRGLEGYYVYSDTDTGRIWAFSPGTRREQPGPGSIRADDHHELARTTYQIKSWGEDADGELYFADFAGGGIHRLVKATATPPTAPFPRKLSETGIFASTREHRVAPGVIPYTVNAPLWSDHAAKERFLAIPGDGRIGLEEHTASPPAPGSPAGWRFPDGTVLVKTFSMDMERGNPRSRRRLETRLLHLQENGAQGSGERHWRGYVYVWNEEQTDAELLDAAGADTLLKIRVGDRTVEQNYRFPSRAQCVHCHTVPAGFVLGVNTMQLNRDHDYGGAVANQLATLEHIGLFTNKLPRPPAELPRLADFNDPSAPLEQRARAYLHANCSHCHRKGGDDWFRLPATLALGDMGVVGVPAETDFGIKDAKIVAPGHPELSIIPHRMSLTGLGRMPHIGSRVVDEAGVELICDWIKAMR